MDPSLSANSYLAAGRCSHYRANSARGSFAEYSAETQLLTRTRFAQSSGSMVIVRKRSPAIQIGDDPDDWKPMRSVGQSVREIRIREESGAFRVIYLAAKPEAVYVLHCFQKKTQKTSKRDLRLAALRFAAIPDEVNDEEASKERTWAAPCDASGAQYFPGAVC